MKRDIWDKLSVIGTFLSSTVIIVFTSLLTFYTASLKNKIDEFKSYMDENTSINKLIQQLNGTDANIKYDLVLLSLERYMRNSSQDAKLSPQDKEMLTGLAQSMILERRKGHDTSEFAMSQMLIPFDFLQRNDTAKLSEVVRLSTDRLHKTKSFNGSINNQDVKDMRPLFEASDANDASTISFVTKRIVYIQYSNLTEKDRIRKIQMSFINNKWVAPGIEHVTGDYENLIKYFHDEDLKTAEDAKTLLGDKFQIIKQDNPKYQKLVPKGQIEIWIRNGN